MGIGVACLATIVLLHGWTLQTARTVLQVDVDIAGGAWAMADLLLALLLVVSGFGLLRRRSWARWLTVGVAALQVVSTLAMVVLLWTHMPEMTGVDERTRASAQAGLVAGTLLRLLGIVYPLVALCVLARRSTAEAFRKDRATP